MLIDIGFWDENGVYQEDWQELNEIEAQEVLRKPKILMSMTKNMKFK